MRLVDRAAGLSGQPWFPYQRDQYRPFYDQWWDYGKRCSANGQRIVAHMSTADVARDLDRLRAAVGDRGLNYLGFSYGSYIGTTTPTYSAGTSAGWSSMAS